MLKFNIIKIFYLLYNISDKLNIDKIQLLITANSFLQLNIFFII